jgi:polyferredoxin
MLNWWALISLITTWGCIGVMAWIGGRQFREVKRPPNGFTRLRYYLLILPLIVMFGAALRVERLYDQLHSHYSPVVTRASLGATLVIVGTTIFMVLIYTYRERK